MNVCDAMSKEKGCKKSKTYCRRDLCNGGNQEPNKTLTNRNSHQ